MELINTHLYNHNWEKRNSTVYVFIHHAKAINFTFQECHEYHKSIGYFGIGYHFYIQKDRRIMVGRPLDIEGAHCYGYNDVSIGICLEGNYELENLSPTMKADLIDMLNYIVKIYPNIKIVTHNQYYDTLCPGKGVLNELDDIISKVNNVQEDETDVKIDNLEDRIFNLEYKIDKIILNIDTITNKMHRMEEDSKLKNKAINVLKELCKKRRA